MVATSTVLFELFKHNKWANERLLTFCEGLSDELLDAALAGTYGSVRMTLVHLLANEENYLTMYTGIAPETTLFQIREFTSFTDLRRRAALTGEGFIKVVSGEVLPETVSSLWQGQVFTAVSFAPLLQVINHGTEHRAHIVTILNYHGASAPMLDAWEYIGAR